MARTVELSAGPDYEILIEDADGRQLCLEWIEEAESGRSRLALLATAYAGMRLILRHRKTLAILAFTEGY